MSTEEAEEALFKAAEEGDLATLKRLVAEGVNLEAADEHGNTALMHAANYNGKLDCLEHLVAKGAILEATDQHGYTALMAAALEGKLDCLEHLVAKGAKLNAQTKNKMTALHCAANYGQAPCVESLLKAGADASLEDFYGSTALDDAKGEKHTEVVKLLEKYTPAYFAAQAANATEARETAARATWAEPGTHKPTLTRASTLGLKRWHFFLSHTQRNGDAKSVALELFFGFSEQGKKIWLDVKMPKMDMEAMKDGVNGSRCVLAIITGGDDTESRYFQRPMCVEELKWAIEAGVKIVPVVTAADKPKVGEYIAEGIAAGIDLSACDFQHIDRSNPIMIEASLKSIMGAEEIAEAGKAKVVAGSALANAGSSVQGLAELLASLKLTEHLGAADAWCVDLGAEDVADLKDEDLAEQLAEVLGLKKIPAKKLVAAIRG